MIDSMMDILQLTIYAIKLSIQIHYYNYLLFLRTNQLLIKFNPFYLYILYIPLPVKFSEYPIPF